MVELGETFELLKKSESNVFIGVNPDKSECCILLTYDNSIIVYDIFLKKIVITWLLGKGKRFTCPVVYNKQDGEYVAVVDHKTIKTFTVNDTTMSESGENYTVSELVLQIFPDTEHCESFVLFQNGAFRSLSSVFESPRNIPQCNLISPDSRLLTSHFYRSGDFVYLAMIMSTGENFTLVYTSFNFSREAETPVYVKIPFKSDAATVASACFCQTLKNSVTVVALWSNGEINRCNLTLSQPMVESNYSTEPQKLTAIKNTKSVNTSSILPLSEDCIAVLSGDNLVVVVDLQFGVTHSVLPEVSQDTMLFALKNVLLMSKRGVLTGSSFTSKPVNLASVLKKQAPSQNHMLDHLKWRTTNSTITPSHEKSVETIEILLKSTDQTELVEAWATLSNSLSPFFKKKISSSSFLRTLMERLTTDEALWFPKLLSDVITTNKISASISPTLIMRIIEKEDSELLLTCLTTLLDITESDIVLTLSFVLGKITNEMETDSKLNSKLMHQLLILPFTDKCLVESLRQLSMEKTMAFLEHLTEKIKQHDLSLKNELTFDKIVSWSCLVLDAHFTQITVSPDSWNVLVNLQEMVELKVELFGELEEIEMIFIKLKKAVTIKWEPLNFTYRIEKMTI